MENDNASVTSSGSTMSTAQGKIECPYCDKDYQIRSIVNHLHSKHCREWACNLRHKAMEEAETGQALKISWSKPSDFEDEPPEIIEVYACLATHKTFMTEDRAQRHFNNNPTALKKHNAEITKLLKQRHKADEEAKKKRATSTYQQAKAQNNPTLIRGMYRNLLYLRFIVERFLLHLETLPLTDIHRCGNYGRKWEEMTIAQLITLARNTISELTNAIENKLMSAYPLEKMWYAFHRVLEARVYFDLKWTYYATATNPEGLLVGEECWGFVHPDMPPAPV